MRYRAVVLTLGLAACSGGLLQAVTEPPSGLAVSVTSTFLAGIVPTTGAIFGRGDSVVAIISSPAVCGKALSADAGTVDAGLVVTVILTSQGVQTCAPLNGMTTYRAVVHGVPAGSYNATAHLRLTGLGGNADTTVAQATIPLP